jgi:hypothetical protein
MSEAPSTPAKTDAAKAEPRARRISNPRPKKSAKPAKPETESKAKSEPAAKFPEFPSTAAESPAAARSDWPEPEPATSGGGSSPENPKRKRRRKKGKGGGQSPANAAAENESPDESSDAPSTAVTQQSQQQPQARPNQPQRVKLDAEQLAKFAWKIYLAEVSEEGVALVGDNDARELSRRCFRLAEIFLEEQARRR